MLSGLLFAGGEAGFAVGDGSRSLVVRALAPGCVGVGAVARTRGLDEALALDVRRTLVRSVAGGLVGSSVVAVGAAAALCSSGGAAALGSGLASPTGTLD
jgi:hypothetical protein